MTNNNQWTKHDDGECPIKGFSVVYRNPGHWDIVRSDVGRVFRIRDDGKGNFMAMDSREKPYPVTYFKTPLACMNYICDLLMHEEFTIKGML